MEVIVGCFRHHIVNDWLMIPVERTKVLARSFTAFMASLHDLLLPHNWERSLHMSMLNCCHQSNDTFASFASAIHAQNSLLTGTASHMDDDRLHTFLESAMCPDLIEDYENDATAKNETEFAKWLSGVKRVDDGRCRILNRIRLLAADNHRKRKNDNDGADDCGSKRNNQNIPPANTSNSASGSNTKRCPALTDGERSLLNTNFGCRKCRKPYVTHRSADGVCDFPLALNYKPLTAGGVKAAFTALSKEAAARFEAARAAKSAAVAAVIDTTYVAAIMADIDDPNDSGTTNGDLSTCVSVPHSLPHLFWDFLMDGPLSDFPVPVCGLNDNGCFLVLINPMLVEKLGLHRFLLHKPQTVNVALSDDRKVPRSLTEYVNLKCVSKDQSYTSTTVRALIAPGLCAPVILGLPWLACNHIVVDHSARTAADKRYKYDLLNPPPLPEAKPPCIKLRDRMKKTKADHILLAAELKEVCHKRQKETIDSNQFETIKEVDVIAAVHERIEVLTEWEHYQKLGDDIKAMNRAIFEPILHVDNLPTDVLCKIKIKDAYKSLSKRNYQSPRKFKDAWERS
jgi:hypothetical protein